MESFSHKTPSDPLQPHEEYDNVLGATKDILGHIIFLFVDILCRFPSVLGTQFPTLYDALLQQNGAPVSVFVDNGGFPTVGQYFGLLAISNISNHLKKEYEACKLSKNANKVAINQSYDLIRRHLCLTAGEKLSRLVDLCNGIKRCNIGLSSVFSLKPSSELKTLKAGDAGTLELESAGFAVDIAELVLFHDKLGVASSSNSAAILDKIVISRLLPFLMNIYTTILQQQIDINKSFTACGTDVQLKHSSIFRLCGRITELLCRSLLTHRQSIEFIVGMPGFLHTWDLLIQSYTETQQVLNINSVWTPFFGLPLIVSRTLVSADVDLIWQNAVTNHAQYITSSLKILTLMEISSTAAHDGEQKAERNSEAVTMEADSSLIPTGSITEPRPVALDRSRLSCQVRLLENIAAMQQMLVQSDIRGNLSVPALSWARPILSSISKSLSSFRNECNTQSTKDNKGDAFPYLQLLDSVTKTSKELMSLSEGAKSSKVD